ncbi:cysteine--tRNA ligase [Candidatus Dojkabacteria bacterium]|nr:cysteine--tRNA ligase [Candidatus Dojkabacteria bacterium]
MLKVFNTLGRKLEEFEPLNKGKISFYHCGPTVYWTQHIGNMRGMLMGDLIRRSLSYLGYEVRHVRNYTDFGHLTGDNIGDADTGEDRMEKAAKRENLTPQIIAEKYIAEFDRDTKLLNILEPTVKARATDYIDGMIEMVKLLIDRGFAYVTSKAVYFDISRFKNYTDLSGRDLEKDKAGAGIGDITDPDKKNPADFVLWFFRTGVHKNALQYWSSPFTSPEVKNGEGFPGWHIECSTMALQNLGETLDIHMGGVEHISIHHTNEIAQSEAVTGKKYVKHWLHNEHLLVNGKKMAKSEGTSYTLKQIIEKGYSPLDMRYLFLQAHYRSKQNFTWEALDGARIAYQKLKTQLGSWLENFKEGKVEVEYRKKYIEALEDDFNIPRALGVLWEVVKADLLESAKLALIFDFDKVFGLGLKEEAENISEFLKKNRKEIERLVDEREKYRGNKGWEEADQIRKVLGKKYHVEIEDQKDGTEWRVIA